MRSELMKYFISSRDNTLNKHSESIRPPSDEVRVTERMAKIENGWFYEFIDAYHGQAMSLEVEEILCQHKSKYQDILIFKSKANGNVLVLDGCIQLTDKDECSYQEMITFLALNSHPNPKKVLVIGAGDGGVIREIAKHHLVESIVQCELDEEVVSLSKTYFPNLSCGYASPKHELHLGCGKEFMRQIQGEFDVIITDSSDCSGPGSALFEKDYYELIKSALNPGGIFCNEGHCPWLDNQFVKTRLEFCRSLFPVVQYAIANVPTYPCGQIGFFMCSRNNATRFEEPVTKFSQEQLSSLNLQFYNSDVHTAAFAIPQFFEKISEDYDGSCYTKDNNWFWPKPEEAPGQSFGLIKKEIVFSEKGQQDILVFKNYIYGNVLVIDGIIQYTEKDQSVYEECIAHLSLNSHPHPKKVLIIGALSGGIIQEVSRHQSVETIVQIEMNATALELSKKYFRRASAGYSSPKLENLHIGDPLLYLKQHRCEFDVIITVPTQMLVNQDTSELLKNALKPNGISISKVPSFWFQLDSIHKLVKHDRTHFPTVKLAYICLPTTPNGQTTFVLRSLNPDTCFETPNHQLSDHHLSQLEFYNSKVHKASFALPEFVKKVVES